MFSIYLSTKFEFLHYKFSIDACFLNIYIWYDSCHILFSHFQKIASYHLCPRKREKKPCFIGYHETNENVSWNFNVHSQNQYYYCNMLSKITFKIVFTIIKFKKKTQNLLWLHFISITLWVILCIWRLTPILCGSSLLKEPLTLVLMLVYSKVIWEWGLILPILKPFGIFFKFKTRFNFTYTMQTF